MGSGEHEIVVGRQQSQAVANAKLGDQGADRAGLNAMAPAGIAQCDKLPSVTRRTELLIK